MANPSANNNSSSTTTITANDSTINGGSSAVPEDSAVGPTERALKHKNISLSKVWTRDEQSLLEELLTKYASDSKVTRFAKIAPKLQDKTVRDVALRCVWMNEKVVDQQVKPSSNATNHSGHPNAHLSNSTDSDDSISYEDIGGELGQLLEENVRAMEQISANFSSLKVHENINLLSNIRNNIAVVLKESLNDMCEMMKNMPPLPFKLNDKLADSIIPDSAVPMEL